MLILPIKGGAHPSSIDQDDLLRTSSGPPRLAGDLRTRALCWTICVRPLHAPLYIIYVQYGIFIGSARICPVVDHGEGNLPQFSPTTQGTCAGRLCPSGSRKDGHHRHDTMFCVFFFPMGNAGGSRRVVIVVDVWACVLLVQKRAAAVLCGPPRRKRRKRRECGGCRVVGGIQREGRYVGRLLGPSAAAERQQRRGWRWG